MGFRLGFRLGRVVGTIRWSLIRLILVIPKGSKLISLGILGRKEIVLIKVRIIRSKPPRLKEVDFRMILLTMDLTV